MAQLSLNSKVIAIDDLQGIERCLFCRSSPGGVAEVCWVWLTCCFLPVAQLWVLRLMAHQLGKEEEVIGEWKPEWWGGEFNTVLISTSGISFAKCFENCLHKIGECALLRVGQLLAGPWAILMLILGKKRHQSA